MAYSYNYVFNHIYNLNHFDKIVYYQLCDFLYDEFKKGIKNRGVGYQSFTSMCSAISNKVIRGVDFSRSEKIIINKLLNRLTSFFGFTDKEAGTYVVGFFYNSIWDKIYKSVTTINSIFVMSKNI